MLVCSSRRCNCTPSPSAPSSPCDSARGWSPRSSGACVRLACSTCTCSCSSVHGKSNSNIALLTWVAAPHMPSLAPCTCDAHPHPIGAAVAGVGRRHRRRRPNVLAAASSPSRTVARPRESYTRKRSVGVHPHGGVDCARVEMFSAKAVPRGRAAFNKTHRQRDIFKHDPRSC